MIGRSTLYGVAAGGEAGAARALEIYREEISRVLALLGCRGIADLGPQYLQFVDPHLFPAALSRPGLRSVAGTKAVAEA
jgi:(S)-mandelate dehydrogenase